MSNYLCKVPVTEDQGPCKIVCSASYRETYRQNALWEYNSMRAHDGQQPLTRMPNGTTYTKIES